MRCGFTRNDSSHGPKKARIRDGIDVAERGEVVYTGMVIPSNRALKHGE
jgi:hypothetical protein